MDSEQITSLTRRAAVDWSRVAGESVATGFIQGTMYGYGSELAVLRLFHKYNCPKARAFYSKTMGSWTFALEMPRVAELAVVG